MLCNTCSPPVAMGVLLSGSVNCFRYLYRLTKKLLSIGFPDAEVPHHRRGLQGVYRNSHTHATNRPATEPLTKKCDRGPRTPPPAAPHSHSWKAWLPSEYRVLSEEARRRGVRFEYGKRL